VNITEKKVHLPERTLGFGALSSPTQPPLLEGLSTAPPIRSLDRSYERAVAVEVEIVLFRQGSGKYLKCDKTSQILSYLDVGMLACPLS
jgi:hypothetical protein